MSEIDPIQFGQLINQVENLNKTVHNLTVEVDDLKQTISGGRGLAIGLFMAAGGIGAGLTKAFDSLFR
jgi:hypothetical protein